MQKDFWHYLNLCGSEISFAAPPPDVWKVLTFQSQSPNCDGATPRKFGAKSQRAIRPSRTATSRPHIRRQSHEDQDAQNSPQCLISWRSRSEEEMPGSYATCKPVCRLQDKDVPPLTQLLQNCRAMRPDQHFCHNAIVNCAPTQTFTDLFAAFINSFSAFILKVRPNLPNCS